AGDGIVARVSPRDSARDCVARIFTRVEDLVYIGLDVLLAGTAVVLLAVGAYDFVAYLVAGALPGHVVELLARILLILMIVEILYTVQVSFSERHGRAVGADRHGRGAGRFALDVATARIARDGRAVLALGGALTFRGQPLDVLSEDLLAERADVLGTDAALLVDEEGLGHAVDAVIDADFSGRIGSVREAQLEVPYELQRSEEHTSELQSRFDLVCRLLLEKKNLMLHV